MKKISPRRLIASRINPYGPVQGAEEGAVTAEFAVALPAVTAVLALCLGAVATGTAQIQLEDTVRVAARAAARGDSEESIRQGADRSSRGASLNITRDGDTVTVQAQRQAPGVIGSITGWVLSAQATTTVEVAGGEEEGDHE